MEDFNKEEVSVFEGLNYRNQMLLEKLFELNKRLHNSTISLGGKQYTIYGIVVMEKY